MCYHQCDCDILCLKHCESSQLKQTNLQSQLHTLRRLSQLLTCCKLSRRLSKKDVYAGVSWQLQLKMMKLRVALSTTWTVQVLLVTLQRYRLPSHPCSANLQRSTAKLGVIWQTPQRCCLPVGIGDCGQAPPMVAAGSVRCSSMLLLRTLIS